MLNKLYLALEIFTVLTLITFWQGESLQIGKDVYKPFNPYITGIGLWIFGQSFAYRLEMWFASRKLPSSVQQKERSKW